MAITRQLTRVVLKSVDGVMQPDTGLTLTLKTEAGATVCTAVEGTAGSYAFTWTAQAAYGYYYLAGAQKAEWGKLWLGEVVGDRNLEGSFTFGQPLIPVNDTLVTNLNADLLDGLHSAAFALAGSGTTVHSALSGLAYTSAGHTGFESQENAQFVSGNLVTRIINCTGSLTQDHAALTNLAYAASSHTGFAGTGVANVFTVGQRMTTDMQVTGSLLVSGSVRTLQFQMTSGSQSGYVLTSDALGNARWTASGSGGGSGTSDHAALSNLAYATALHTGFAGTGVVNQFTAGQQFQTDVQVTGSARLTENLTALGSVGIGTASPVSKLEVVHSSGTRPFTLYREGSTVDYTTSLGFSLRDVNGVRQEYAAIYGAIQVATPGGYGGYLRFDTANGGTIDERMRIIANGNVGIGTTIPQTKLHVNGGGVFVGDVQVTGSLRLSGVLYGNGSGLTSVTGSLTRDHAGLTNLEYAASGHTGFESQANAQFVSGNLVTRINNSANHANLTNLLYSTSGHTGFAGTAAQNVFTADQQVTGSLLVSGSVAVLHFQMSSGSSAGYVLTSDAVGNARWTASGSGGAGTTDHAVLSNLSYATSAHTGFTSQANFEFVSASIVALIATLPVHTEGASGKPDDGTGNNGDSHWDTRAVELGGQIKYEKLGGSWKQR